MKTFQTRYEQTTAASLDRSFNEWVPRHELAELVPHLVKGATETPTIIGTAGSSGAGQTEMTLAILVYCYAIGIYRSREIEQRVVRIPQGGTRGQVPAHARLNAAAFAQFRHLHAPLLKACLASALFQAFRVQWNMSGPRGTLPPRRLLDRRQSDSNPVQLLESEAQRRLEVAEAWDRFDQEGWLGNADQRK